MGNGLWSHEAVWTAGWARNEIRKYYQSTRKVHAEVLQNLYSGAALCRLLAQADNNPSLSTSGAVLMIRWVIFFCRLVLVRISTARAADHWQWHGKRLVYCSVCCTCPR